MKFAHMADVHLGSWREPKMRELATQSFITAFDEILREKVDFILIAGDLFHTAIPTIDNLKLAVKKCNEARMAHIPIYIIAGSHDYSPSGKTMIDVLEEAGLVTNVMRGQVSDNGLLRLHITVDKKTDVKITGIIGRKGMLDRSYYEQLDTRNLESEPGFKIFMFHTALEELKPDDLKEMEASPISMLPKGFNYYAGGHVHVVRKASLPGYSTIVYPGPVYPANTHELEQLKCGTYTLYNNGTITTCNISLKPVLAINVQATAKNKDDIMADIAKKTEGCKDAVVLIRLEGVMQGATKDVSGREIVDLILSRGAYHCMVNKTKLTNEHMRDVTVTEKTVEEVESALIQEHKGTVSVDFAEQEDVIIRQLIHALSQERLEGEKVSEYQSRIKRFASDCLRI